MPFAIRKRVFVSAHHSLRRVREALDSIDGESWENPARYSRIGFAAW
jgi:hypothetical protein